MHLKNFRFNVVLRVSIITGLSISLATVLVKTDWFFTPLVISLLLLVVVADLIRYVEKTNSDLTQFLLSIRQGGFTNAFTGGQRGSSQMKLGDAFNQIIAEFQKISREKESQYIYLNALNENIGISLISYDESGNIQLMNPAAKALLCKPYLKNIKDITAIDNGLYRTITTLKSGERLVTKVYINQELVQVSVLVKDFKVQEANYRVVLLQNIHVELDQKEVDAWQKLISVLTHEIMNSVTPIVSLSSALNQMLAGQDLDTLDEEDKDDIITSVQTIENRSKGLLRFVNAYKDYSKTPQLKIADINIISLIERIVNLLGPDIAQAGIRLNLDYKTKELHVKADFELIEQVLINLLKNAIEALEHTHEGCIEVIIRRAGARRVSMEIRDNGKGMDEETLDRAFVPFYTTKRKGTGVGLSFARQILRFHQGTITVKSEPGHGASFRLEF